MEYRLKTYSIWDCGKRVDANGAPHQEDNMFPAHGQATDADRLFILCDGMGGHDAGEVASATVCEAMSKSILSATTNPEGDFSEEILQKAIADAFVALDTKDDGTVEKKMGTTMTLLKLYNGGCFIAHMGDSRVYHIRPGKTATDTKILFRTEDHSLVNDLVKAGELTEEEARQSHQKNVITRAMQPHMEHHPKADIYHTIDIRPGDYFYLCSDGMLENMEDHQLCFFFSEAAGDDENKRESLLKATQENRDNHSAIFVHITDVFNPIKNGEVCFSITDKAPLMGVVQESNNRQRSTGKTVKSKKSKEVTSIIALIVIVLALVAIFYPKPVYEPKKVKPIEQSEDIHSISKPYKEEPKATTTKSDVETSGQSIDDKSSQIQKAVSAVVNKNDSTKANSNDTIANTNIQPNQSETEGTATEKHEEVTTEESGTDATASDEQEVLNEPQETEDTDTEIKI